jgi:tetratricopeptide (TPR) repeat protein
MRELAIHHVPAEGDRPPQVRVSYRKESGAQAQERVADFDFAVTDEQRRLLQWYLEEYLLFPYGEFCNRAQQAEDLMRTLGVQLFEAVFRDPQAAAIYGRVANDLGNTRIVVHADSSEGGALPWELLRDPTRGEYGDLARLAHAFVRSRHDPVFDLPDPPRARKTVNILMVICRPGGPDTDVPFQSVARPLLELFRPHRDRVRLDVLRPPTFEQLTKVLGERANFYHVLHFDGHGTFPERPPGPPGQYYAEAGAQGPLAFEGDGGGSRLVTGEELGGLLAGRGVPMVLLNACQSGMTRPEAVYPSVGSQLLKAGTRGVVAMAYSVYVATAVRFMARLYEGLLKGEELARAVWQAREDLRAHPQRPSPRGDFPLRDWVVPVLLEAAPVRLTKKPLAGLQFDTDSVKDEQARAGAEVDCPEPPAFGFVGRDGVVLELDRAFQSETVVLLRGMAGVGKTEAAVGFARWRAETGALDGPIFFFSFEHRLPLSEVCNRVGEEFRREIKQKMRKEWARLKPAERRKTALKVLKQVPCLLVWDNFEPVAGFPAGTASAWKEEEQQDLRKFLSELRGSRTKVLLTSRRDEQWLGPIYRPVDLGGLKLAEAQELALKVLARAGLNAAQIKALPQYNDLLRYLGGNPLAIQTILPELKRVKPDELLRSLQAGEVGVPRDDLEQGRERSLAASLSYRLDTLEPAQKNRLGLLALFQRFVNADVLAALCSVEGVPESIRGLALADWVELLDRAAEIGLLRRAGKGCCWIHPALPWFFHDLLRAAFPGHQAKLEQAFATTYAVCGRYFYNLFETNTQVAMDFLRAEEGNLLFALRLARQHERWDEAEGILSGLYRLWKTQGRLVEWERSIAEVEAQIVGDDGEPLAGGEYLWGALLGHRQEIAYYRRDFNTQEVILLRLKEHCELSGDEQNQAVCLHLLGMVAEERGQLEEAERCYRDSLAIRERIGGEHGQAGSLCLLGRVAKRRGQLEEAERWYRDSLAITERIGDESGQAQSLRQLGSVAERRGQLDEAERCYRDSLAIEERIGDEHEQSGSLHQLGSVAERRGQLDEAERWYRQAEAILVRVNDPANL